MQKAASDAAIDSMRQSKGTIEGIADTQVMKAGEDADAKAATFFDKKETDREMPKPRRKRTSKTPQPRKKRTAKTPKRRTKPGATAKQNRRKNAKPF